METSLRFGMLHTVYTGAEAQEEIEQTYVENNKEKKRKITISKRKPVVCKDSKCGRRVAHEDVCFVDTHSDNGDIYCDSCGKCLRYERKMAARRKELAEERLKQK